MTYPEAKAIAEALWADVKSTGAILQGFPKGRMGLTPDDVKASAEFQAAKRAYDVAFKRLRDFNGVFTKTFKAEIRAERREKRPPLNN